MYSPKNDVNALCKTGPKRPAISIPKPIVEQTPRHAFLEDRNEFISCRPLVTVSAA
jgi:hypothetical protein